MRYLRFQPVAPLSKFVDCLWFFEGARANRELAIPTGTSELVFNLRQERVRVFADRDDLTGQHFDGSVVCGTHAHAFVLDSAQHGSALGVHFRPGGAAPFLGVPLSELADRHVALEDLWGTAARQLRQRLLEASSPQQRFDLLQQALLARLSSRVIPHPVVRFALDQFSADPTVARVQSIVEASGYSAKRFIRVFSDGVGLAPKRYCRVLRLQAVIDRLTHGRHIEWAHVAVSCGYFDQSHLIRDFRAMTGLTPAQYLPVDDASPNHVALDS